MRNKLLTVIVVLVAVLGAGALNACSSTPEVTLPYYLPRADTKVSIVQTVACDMAKKTLIVSSAVTPTIAFFPDLERPQTVNVQDFDGTFVNATSTFSFTDDLRLKSVNASSTGQGEATLKAALATAKIALGAVAAAAPIPPERLCTVVDDYGAGKALTLTYTGVMPFPRPPVEDLIVQPDINSATLHDLLKARLPEFRLRLASKTPMSRPISDGTATPAITLSEVQNVTLEVTAAGKQIWTQQFVVPAPTTYRLPVPKAAAFGKQTFALTLSDAGQITSISYGRESGTASALTAAGGVGTAVAPESPSESAAAAKAQADEIAQRERLARCLANPTGCT